MSDQNILVTEAYSAKNIGDLELVVRSLRAAKLLYPSAKIACVAVDPESFMTEIEDVPFLPKLFPRLRLSGCSRWRRSWILGRWMVQALLISLLVVVLPRRLLRAVGRTRWIPMSSTLRSYLSADCFIAVGGGYLGDQYRNESLLVAWSWWISSRMAPVRTMPMSFEISGTRLGRVFAVLTKRIHLNVRDSESLARSRRLGLSASLVPDLAFLNASSSRRILDRDAPLKMAVAPVGSDYLGEAEFDRFVQAIVGSIDATPSVREVLITVMHDVIGATTIGGDRVAAEKIAERLRDRELTVRVLAPERYDDVLDVFESVDIALCARMHAGIASLCAGTPVGLLAYERKHFALVSDLGVPSLAIDIHASDAEYLDLMQRVCGLSRSFVLELALGRRELLLGELAGDS